MNISPNYRQNSPQFEAIKRVKCNLNEFIEINKTFEKELNTIAAVIFKNKSPNHAKTGAEVLNTAQKEGVSVEWVFENCKRNGINLPNINSEPLYIFTEDSIAKLALYNLKNLFSEFFFGLTHAYSAGKEVPPHLLNIKVMNDCAEKLMPKFEKFLKKNLVEEITLEELKNLIIKMTKQ